MGHLLEERFTKGRELARQAVENDPRYKLLTEAQKNTLAGMMASNIQKHEQHETAIFINEVLQMEIFKRACSVAGVEPSRRQAAKFVKQEGAAWTTLVAHADEWEVK